MAMSLFLRCIFLERVRASQIQDQKLFAKSVFFKTDKRMVLIFYKPFIVFDLVWANIWIFFTLSPSLCRPQILGSHLSILTKLVSLERSWASRVTIGYFFISVGTVSCARLKNHIISYYISYGTKRIVTNVTMLTNFRTKQKQKISRNTQLSHKRRVCERMREIKIIMFACSFLSCLWMLCCVLMLDSVIDSTIYFSVLVLFLLMKKKRNDWFSFQKLWPTQIAKNIVWKGLSSDFLIGACSQLFFLRRVRQFAVWFALRYKFCDSKSIHKRKCCYVLLAQSELHLVWTPPQFRNFSKFFLKRAKDKQILAHRPKLFNNKYKSKIYWKSVKNHQR
jgi:hypothetical protein